MKYSIDETTLKKIADSVRAKTGSTDAIKVSDISTEISNISTGGSSLPEDEGAVFYDYDGTVLHAFTNAEIQSMTSLPDLPTREGLVCEGWNWDLDEIKQFSENQVVNVGAIYNTFDGKTRIYIELTEGLLEPCLYLNIAGTLHIDWGDGTIEDIETGGGAGTRTIPHAYSNPGEYIITFDTTDLIYFGFTSRSNSHSGILTDSSGNEYATNLYGNCITKIEIGNKIDLQTRALSKLENLSEITISKNTISTSSTYLFNYTSSLKHINLPKDFKISQYAFQYCYGLKSISHNSKSFGAYAFQYCYKLNKITFSTTQIADYCFRACYSLENIYIPDVTDNIGYYIFHSCYSLEKVVWNSPSNISDYNFYYCYSLKEFDISSSKSLGSSVFVYCNNFKKATLNSNITTIPSSLFYNAGIAIIEFLGNITSLSTGFQKTAIRVMKFSGNTTVPASPTTTNFPIVSGLKIVVPDNLYDEWVATWSSYASYIVKASEYSAGGVD